MLSTKTILGILGVAALIVGILLILQRREPANVILDTMNPPSGETYTAQFAGEAFTFLVPTAFTVAEQQGPDFKTFYLTGGKGTFGIYAGYHPNIFHPEATFQPKLTGIYQIREASGQEDGEYWHERLIEGMFGPENTLTLHVFYRTSDPQEKELFDMIAQSVQGK
jgi:hypothetical protein